jgi:tetratricopeptide (TPR) repeat protein
VILAASCDVSRWWSPTICLGLLLLVAVAFAAVPDAILPNAHVFQHRFLVCDDDPYVYGNGVVRQGITWPGVKWAFLSSAAGNWHPLTWLSHMFDVQCYDLWLGGKGSSGWLSDVFGAQEQGLRPGGHHLTNLLLHATSAVLLFLALRLMTGSLWASAMAAGMFAVHPLRVESVAWVAERKDVLSTMLGLATIWAYACYARRGAAHRHWIHLAATAILGALGATLGLFDWQQWHGCAVAVAPSLLLLAVVLACDWRYLIVVVLFALGLMAKSMLVTLPCVLLLLDFWPLRRFGPTAPACGSMNASPGRLSCQAFVWLVVEKLPLLALSAGVSVIVAISQSGAGGMTMLAGVTFSQRVANAFVSYVAYLWKTIWPANLAIFYPHPSIVPSDPIFPLTADGQTLFSLTVQAIGAAILLAAITFAVLKMVRRRPYLAVGWFWYLGTLLPVIGLIQIGAHAMADRYTYLPGIGLSLMAVWGAADLAARWPLARRGLWVAGPLLLASWVVLTAVQVTYWHDSLKVFGHAIQVTSNNYFAHNHLGLAYDEAARGAEAANHLDEARDYDAKAAAEFAETVRLAPKYDAGHINLGGVYAHAGQFDKAVACFLTAAEINPYLVVAHSNLAAAYLDQGKLDDALAQGHEALRMAPGDESANLNVAACYLQRGDFAAAISYSAAALQTNPTLAHACWILGCSLLSLNRVDEAVDPLERAVRFRPNHPDYLNSLAAVYARKGDVAKAIQVLQRALQINPQHSNALRNLQQLQNFQQRLTIPGSGL